MQKREGRSFAAPSSRPPQPEPGRTGRKRWERPHVPRPTALLLAPLSLPAAVASGVEETEEADVVDVMTVLSVEARRDLLAGFSGGRL